MHAETDCNRFRTDLTAFHQGELSADRQSEIELHLRSCESCSRALAEVRNVFDLAGRIEDLSPSMRFKRNLDALVRRSTHRPAEVGGLLARIRAAGEFLAHRLRTSRRFRLATVSVGAHVVLLLLVSLVVIPKVAERHRAEIRSEWGAGLIREPAETPDLARAPAAGEEPEIPQFTPHVVDREPFARSAGDLDLGPVGPYLPPVERPAVQPLSGLFASALRPEVKSRRLAAWLDDSDAAARAIARALEWLADRQLDDGSFPVSPRGEEYSPGVTATVLLAYFSDGHSETRGRKEYRRVVTKAVDRLLLSQRTKGDRAGLLGPPEGHFAYNHALATLALTEAYVMDLGRLSENRTARIRQAVRLALRFLERTQTEAGAWPYGAGPNAAQTDTSVAIFNAMAIAGARGARFPVADGLFRGFTRWLRAVTGEDGTVGYQRPGDRDEAPRTLTAGALFVEETLGIAAPVRDRQAELVQADLRDPHRTKRNSLLRFYAAMAFRARGTSILDRFAPDLLANQTSTGAWTASADEWAVYGGDAFVTALNVLTLTSVYRITG